MHADVFMAHADRHGSCMLIGVACAVNRRGSCMLIFMAHADRRGSYMLIGVTRAC